MPVNLHLNRNVASTLALSLALMLGNASGAANAQALTPAFTYQGELRLATGPASDPFDMQFRLFNAATDGAQIGATVTATNVAVSGGLFSVPLDFGVAQFAGERQWLEIAIRPAGSGSYETLSPRTEITAAPYAWSAAVALGNSVTTTSIVDGTVGTADINTSQVQRRVTGSCPAGQYVQSVSETGTVTCGADANAGGTVTSVATGAGLTGGPITANGTISVAPGGIGTTEINAAQVQRRVSGTCAVGSYVRTVNEDGTVVCGTDATGSDWSLTGNAGTNPATNFIGTTDAQAFSVRAGNQRVALLEAIALPGPAGGHTANVLLGSRHNEITPGVRGATISGGGVQSGDSEPGANVEAPNRVTDHYGTVGGGYANQAGNAAGTTDDGLWATVGGGVANVASNVFSTVGGGAVNTASGLGGTVAGGDLHTASGEYSAIGGGRRNTANGAISTVGGGGLNIASGSFSVVAGGSGNTASGSISTIAGGGANTANMGEATVSGGSLNEASADAATVGGGRSNRSSGLGGIVGGGFTNTASGPYSTVGGGETNEASANAATVAGGRSNRSSGVAATVGGGVLNIASGTQSTVGGGENNVASGIQSTASGGALNCAGGTLSWAGGRQAKVRPALDPVTGICSGLGSYPGGTGGDAGTFIWADNQPSNFVSSGQNQFLIRTSGGAVITANSATNDPAGNRLRVDGTLRVDVLGTAAATTLCRNASNQIASCSSSARYKSDIADLELGLATALRLHAVGYRWKDTGAADVGFVAEEIAAIDERLVTRNAKGEIEGVKYDRLTAVLANAVQELAARGSLAAEELSRVDAENAAMRLEQDRLADENEALQSRLAAIEARLGLAGGEGR